MSTPSDQIEFSTPDDLPSDTSSDPPSISRFSRRRFPLSNLQIILIALIIVGGRLAIDFGQRIVDGQEKIKEQLDLESEIRDLQAEERRLEAEKAYYSSPAFIEAWAHDEGKMVRDGERLIVPVYQDIPPTQQVATTPAEDQTIIPSWLVWWTLFFDAPPPVSITGS